MKKQKKGFTLIELMVVMAIIAVLATLIIAAINTARKSSRDTTRRSNVKSLQAGLESYAAANSGKYPFGANTDLDSTKTAIGNYLSSATSVKDPATEISRYCYSSGTAGTPNVLSSTYVLRFVSEATATAGGTWAASCASYTPTGTGATAITTATAPALEDFSVN